MIHSMSMLGNKWKPVIIYRIGQRSIRFSQLALEVTIISRKVLADQLKELEEDGILLRQAFSELPPRVEYSLTTKGMALLPILEMLCAWDREFGGGHTCTEMISPVKKKAPKVKRA